MAGDTGTGNEFTVGFTYVVFKKLFPNVPPEIICERIAKFFSYELNSTVLKAAERWATEINKEITLALSSVEMESEDKPGRGLRSEPLSCQEMLTRDFKRRVAGGAALLRLFDKRST
jgi:hypothetical protein